MIFSKKDTDRFVYFFCGKTIEGFDAMPFEFRKDRYLSSAALLFPLMRRLPPEYTMDSIANETFRDEAIITLLILAQRDSNLTFDELYPHLEETQISEMSNALREMASLLIPLLNEFSLHSTLDSWDSLDLDDELRKLTEEWKGKL